MYFLFFDHLSQFLKTFDGIDVVIADKSWKIWIIYD